MLEFIADMEIYNKVICEQIPRAKKFLWLATADLKDLHVDKHGKMVPFLEVLSDLVFRHVEVRLLHAKEPGPAFRRDFDKYVNLIKGMERILCPRVHVKSVIVDGEFVVARGGDWFHAHGVDSETRRKYNDHSGLSFLGFRVVRSLY